MEDLKSGERCGVGVEIWLDKLVPFANMLPINTSSGRRRVGESNDETSFVR